VTPEGQGIGYIIKDDGISVCASSKHLQTRRFLDNLQSYLYEIQRMLIQAWRQANDRSDSFVDHSGTVRDARTGKAIEVILRDDGQDNDDTLGETVEYPRGWRILIVGLSQSLDLGSMMLGLTCSKLNALGNMLSVSHVVVDFRPINVY
jgi:predicted naringenin-chalcone synthase